MDVTTIIAGLLHDVPEDTGTTIAEIEAKFGRDVAVLVEGVTKIGKMAFSTKVEREAENFRKMVLAMAKDIRVILIKLADRLHNMRTIDPLPEAKRRRIALETLDIYAPLANRLGIAWMKTELEDLAFRQLHPAEYEDISQRVTKKHQEQEAYIAEVQQLIQAKLADAEVPAEVSGRAKHYYGIWAKMVRQNIPFDQVYDIIAVRVITDSVRNCYAVLGTIHSLWTPVPGRFKDFIAMPKANGYQSLHTTVIGPGGERVEFQIRTRDMHGIAQHGVAAHWKYKEGFKGETRFDDSQKWLKGLLEWQKELKDPREFLETVRVDLFPDEVYAFTPRGRRAGAAARRDAGGFRLRGAHRRRPPLRRRQGQRPHRAAALPDRQRRHHRDPDPERARAEQGLAEARADLARQGPDQVLDQDRAARPERDARPRPAREGAAQIRAADGEDPQVGGVRRRPRRAQLPQRRRRPSPPSATASSRRTRS